MERSTIDLWVGAFVIAAVFAVVFMALKVGNLASISSPPGYQLSARFDNIGGLKVRGPVKSAGVVVGRVKKIALDPKTYEAVVTMQIDDTFRFSKDTIAAILTSGLLGEQYIGLDPGGDPQMLQDGNKIEKTQSAIVLEQMISRFLFSKAAEAGDGGGSNGGNNGNVSGQPGQADKLPLPSNEGKAK